FGVTGKKEDGRKLATVHVIRENNTFERINYDKKEVSKALDAGHCMIAETSTSNCSPLKQAVRNITRKRDTASINSADAGRRTQFTGESKVRSAEPPASLATINVLMLADAYNSQAKVKSDQLNH
ncbi:hypothetical protein Tco_0961796, partial [Tanacetum coccineum]